MKPLRIAIACSTKDALKKEYSQSTEVSDPDEEPPPDFFAEGDDYSTISAVANALKSKGHTVKILEGNIHFPNKLRSFKPNIVFNIAEGLFGEMRESYVPMICESLRIPYTGPSPLTLAICLNKALTKKILHYHNIPTARFKIFSDTKNFNFADLSFPLMIKPIGEGSSKGICENSFVESPKKAKKIITEKIRKYNQPVIAEEFLPGDEFTVAVWGNPPSIEVLPLIKINFDKLPPQSKKIYSYEAKWIWDTEKNPLQIFECPAKVNKKLKKQIQKIAMDTYLALNIKDWCRIDIRLDKNNVPNIIELNPLPGILPDPKQNSCFPKAARTAGYSYEQMINKILNFACKRYNIT